MSVTQIVCPEAERLQSRELKNRAKGAALRLEPWMSSAYLHAANELKVVRHQHACDCAVCLEAERLELAKMGGAA